MSDPISVLQNASYEGGIATIREIGPTGMITLRGDFGTSALRKAASKAAGVELPETRMCSTEGESGIAWMAPDELLIMGAYADVPDRLAQINKAIAKHHALAVNVSDARAVFRVSGPQCREVMAKLAPVDLSAEQFTPGMFRRTRMAQAAAAFWMPDAETFQIICFRSVGQYMFDLLKVAAQPGSEVGFFKLG